MKIVAKHVLILSLFASVGAGAEPALKTSSGKPFVPKAGYPIWSWDTVQEYKMFGDSRLLKDDEVALIASLSNFIAIEKAHGTAELGVADLGARHEARRFKQLNPDIKVLFYFNGAIAYNFTSYTRDFSTRSDKMTDQQKRDLLLFDTKANAYHTVRGSNRYAWDILKPTLRTWWSETVGDAVRETGTDGVFWDQMHGWVWMRNRRNQDIVNAHVLMQQMTKRAMGEDKILLCNNAAHNPLFIQNCDAVMYEHYKPERYRENLQRYVTDWDEMLAVANAGKINVYRWGIDFVGTPIENTPHGKRIKAESHDKAAVIAKERISFPLACFLIGAQPYSYFMLSWGWGLHTGALVAYPEMDKPLGPPLGPYERQSADKWIFTRQFERAYVWVDLETQESSIAWW